MDLGAFSVSLAVKDLAASRAFYEALGFAAFAGDPAQNWLMLRNGAHVIGLFQGMFERNMLTFNPGWNQDAEAVENYTDVRDLQRELRARGLSFVMEADETTAGPASVMLMDPDGNPVLLDQHV
ncbi:MAG: VOC family protein [Chloroflexi bacterium]|nr:VOC family protein [Chloroflexota bacterium]